MVVVCRQLEAELCSYGPCVGSTLEASTWLGARRHGRGPSLRRAVAAATIAVSAAVAMEVVGRTWIMARGRGLPELSRPSQTRFLQLRAADADAGAAPEDAAWELRIDDFANMAADGDALGVRSLYGELKPEAPQPELVDLATWLDTLDEAAAESPKLLPALSALAEAAASLGAVKESVGWLLAIREVEVRQSAEAAEAQQRALETDFDGEETEELPAHRTALALTGAACAGALPELLVGTWLAAAAAVGLAPGEVGIARVMHKCALAGGAQAAAVWMDEMKRAGMTPDIVCYSTLIHAYTREGKPEEACQLAEEMTSSGLSMTLPAYNAAITSYAKAGDSDKAATLLESMEESYVMPDQTSYVALLDSFAKKGDAATAVTWLEEMNKRGTKPEGAAYERVIAAYARSGQARGAVRYFTEMVDEGFPPTVRAYNAIINACGKRGDTQGALKWFEELCRTEGLVPDKFSYTEVINAFAKKGQPGSARQWLLRMYDAGIVPDAFTYASVMGAFAKAGREADVEQVMSAMKAAGVTPNAQAWTWLIVAGNMKRRQPTKQESTAAATIFRRMVASGVKPTQFTMKALDEALGSAKRNTLCKELGVEVEERQLVAPPIRRWPKRWKAPLRVNKNIPEKWRIDLAGWDPKEDISTVQGVERVVGLEPEENRDGGLHL
eukprot:TRINITY_DN18840_c0_g1_i1.p1 TRINITY_DN18840_c0_g1~~TRINITY_DN18840_c0_g1_i1.p1  ORF type:complete len:671 (-),score=163.40 TRINITY_DN18840_c0_g1_i1:9-2021(-)